MTWSESIQIITNIHGGIKKAENTYTKADSVLKSNNTGKDLGISLEDQYLSISV